MLPNAIRDRVKALLGNQVGNVTFADSSLRSYTEMAGWQVEDRLFRTTDGTHVPAYFMRPPAGRPPVPAILYCHAHGDQYHIGRQELLSGRPALVSPYAPDLIALGCAVLCLEMPCFGERGDLDESATAKSHLWRGQPLFGQMLAELTAGISFLADHPSVDASHIAAMGISMGGTHTWWLAALDPRLRAAVSMCCFSDLQCLIDTGQHDGHGHYMTVPSLLQTCSTGTLAGLAAPTAQLICVGLQDWSTPADCFAKARHELELAYQESNAADLLEFHVEPDLAHQETQLMRQHVIDFLAGRLCK